MGRREDDGFDLGIVQSIRKIRRKLEAEIVGKGTGIRVGIDAAHEMHLRATGIDEARHLAAPPAETDQCGCDRIFLDHGHRLSTRLLKGWTLTLFQTPAFVKGSALLKATISSLVSASKTKSEPIMVSLSSASNGPDMTVLVLPVER
jgi:hypothetical protein